MNTNMYAYLFVSNAYDQTVVTFYPYCFVYIFTFARELYNSMLRTGQSTIFKFTRILSTSILVDLLLNTSCAQVMLTNGKTSDLDVRNFHKIETF